MSPTSTYTTMPTTTTTQHYLLQHPLDTTPTTVPTMTFSRRTSISSDISEEESIDNNRNNWSQILSQFDSQPDMMQLIQLCKQEEDKRRQEETSLKVKEDKVLRQLQFIQFQSRAASAAAANSTDKDFQLHLPPLSSHNK
jgi:hypothetical protein